MAASIYATLETNHGDIVVIELFLDQAPKTVENFVGLAERYEEGDRPDTVRCQDQGALLPARADLPMDHPTDS